MIVTLCGSTRFKNEFDIVNMQYTLKGYIVLAPGCYAHALGITLDNDVKNKLDILHKQKIAMSNLVVIICPNNYIGESTRSEIEYADSLNIPIVYITEPQL